jgi:1A family penicillin-binding protein
MPVSFHQHPHVYYHREKRWFQKPVFYIPAGVLAVLVIAAGIYWLILAADLRRQAAAYDLRELEQMESASVIVDRNDRIFGQIYVENRETVPYHQLPRDLINAVVAVEDTKFYTHSGYDALGMVRAMIANLTAGGVRQGASTITQQLARNTFALRERTLRRKLVEIFLARRIEEQYGKQKIMELYLNRIYFGGGLYGAEAASRGYFGKPAKEMKLTEAATLAGLIKSPNRLSPWTDLNASRDARNVVLARMRDVGFISQDRFREAVREEIVVGSRQMAQGQTYAVEYIRQQVIAAVGWDRAMAEGYRIRTTIDADLQKVAEESLKANLDRVEQTPGYEHETYAAYAERFRALKKAGKMSEAPAPEYLQGAVIALDNQTGGVLALVGGRDFEHAQYDRALQARRPAGTAMKPFVFAAAFEKGMFPGTVVEDSALDNRVVMIGGTTGILGEWGPERADNRYEGPITARQALAKGKNGATVRLGLRTGVEPVLDLAKAAGIRSQLRPYPATFLGASEVTVAELALAYTAFPNGGWRADAPHVLESIEEKDGTVVWQSPKRGNRTNVMKPEVAYQVHSVLVDALENGTGAVARERFGLQKIPSAGGKTGTAYDFTEALFAGYDSAITVVVRAGFDKPKKIFRGAFGSEVALPVWVDVMNASVQRYPPKELPQPPGLNRVEICARSGQLATDKCFDKAAGGGKPQSTVYRELATKEQMPTDGCNIHGDARTRIAHDLPDAGVPRAEIAVDVQQVRPVALRGPTLLADKDPYNAVRSTVRPPKPPGPDPATEASPPPAIVEATPLPLDPLLSATPAPFPEDTLQEEPILRAEPVAPGERVQPSTTPEIVDDDPRRAEPVYRAQPVDPRAIRRTPTTTGSNIPRAQPVNPRESQPRRAQPVTPDEEEE